MYNFDTCIHCGVRLIGVNRYFGECDTCKSLDYTRSSWFKSSWNIPTKKFSKGKPSFKHWRLFQMSSPRIYLYMFKFLSDRYAIVTCDENKDKYIYAVGEIPILLVAHIDTVHKKLPRVEQDYQENVLWSKTGLGADDRAGVAAIVELLSRGYRPHVLFTNGEESGCIGARAFAKDFQFNPPEVNCIIELDRRGSNDAVYYNDGNEEFHEYIEKFGFTESYGSFSDISKICPSVGISGVNLSIGYYNPHSEDEYLKLDEWEATVDRVEAILNSPPLTTYKYKEKLYTYNYSWCESRSYLDDYDTALIKASLGDINVEIDALDLVHNYGGTVMDWEEFLDTHKEELECTIRDKVLDIVYDLCTQKVPDFLI